LNGILYFIDGSIIKSLDSNGNIRIIIGKSSNNEMFFRPIGCNSSIHIEDMRFYWPTSLAINPIDNSIYVLDEQVIYKITSYNTVEIVIGMPTGCEQAAAGSSFIRLNSPIDMAFNTEGDLFILENDRHSGKHKQIKVLKSNGEIEVFFGDGSLKSDYSFEQLDSLPAFSNFNDPVAIAVHQNKSVYVLDRGKFYFKTKNLSIFSF
jgi:hypothetical protein